MTERLRGRKLQERRAWWFRQHPLCAHCLKKGRATAATELDHVKPLSQGGTDSQSNWQSLCTDCHKAKSLRERGIEPRPHIGLDGYPIEQK